MTGGTIDPEHYKQGRAAFARGDSLLSLARRFEAAESVEQEERVISFALGFADALLDHIRKPAVIVQPALSRPEGRR